MNVLQKLIKARSMFLEEGVKKSGKNMQLEFKYFELEDIVPPAIKIFKELGLTPVVSFNNQIACMKIWNADDPAEPGVEFTVPYKEVEIITSNSGKAVTNSLQALGSTITYLRRYLYMMALDICEPDSVDANLGDREKAKTKLTNVEGKADELQIIALKKAMEDLVNNDNSQADFVNQILVKTNNLTGLTRKQAEQLILKLNDMVAQTNVEVIEVAE